MLPPISIIVAHDNNLAIGKDNDLLWHISADLKRFKALTSGHSIIMGRKTFESLPKGALPNRKNIVISRDESFTAENCVVVNSVDDVLKEMDSDKENFIIGGASIYEAFMPIANKLYLTIIDSTFDADTYLNDYHKYKWKTINETELFTDEKSGLRYRYIDLIRG